MNIEIREYKKEDIFDSIEIWNKIVDDGMAFPQTEPLDEINGDKFFSSQSFTGIAYDTESENIVGLYILHPNNIICNASYAVKSDLRVQHIGEKLVSHSLSKAKELGFRIMQFNAVVESNTYALKLYKKLGFIQLGVTPKGFLNKNGKYENIILHYMEL